MPLSRSQRPQAIEVAGRPSALALLGEGVEEGVGGGVVGLAGAAEGAGRRGEEDEGGEVELLGQLVQVPGGVCLGGEDALELLGVQRLDRAVGEHPGAVDHRAEGVLGGDRGEELLQRPCGRRRRRRRSVASAPSSSSSACSSSAPSRLGAAAADQEQVAGAVVARPGGGR